MIEVKPEIEVVNVEENSNEDNKSSAFSDTSIKDDKTSNRTVTTLNPVDIVNKSAEELVTKIIATQNTNELETLYSQFKINNTKKNALRVTELNNLLDSVNNEAIRRFNESPDTMSNKEVLDYMTAVQNQIDRSEKVVEEIKDINGIQVNNQTNNTVNINVGNQDLNSLNRDSRDRITSFISQILKEGNNFDDSFIDIDLSDQATDKKENV